MRMQAAEIKKGWVEWGMQELGMGGWVLQLLLLQLGAGSLDAGRCSNIDGITILAATAAAAWHLQRRRHE